MAEQLLRNVRPSGWGRSNTQWTAQFLVAAELCRRGCTVSFTMGNATPVADLIVNSPSGRLFLVDVKGQITRNGWRIQRRPLQPTLYYVFVLVGLAGGGDDHFYVMGHSEVLKADRAYTQTHPDSVGGGGFLWAAVTPYANRWDTLPP